MSTPVDFSDFVAVVVTWYAENILKIDPTNHNRVAPGGLTLATNESMFDWY